MVDLGIAMRTRLTGVVAAAGAMWRCNSAGMAMSLAVAAPVLLAVLGLASDYAMMTGLKGELQAAADAAAIAGAREIPLALADELQVASAAKSYAAYELMGDATATEEDFREQRLDLNIAVGDDFSTVTVGISEAWTPFFAHFLASGITPVAVSATARFVGRNNVCVLGLATDKTAILLDKNARLTGNNCGVFSNSPGHKGLQVDQGAVLSASIICSAGGASLDGSANVTPVPVTDCPPVADPLASRPAPSVGACDYQDINIGSGTTTIEPGVYCGGLSIAGNAKVTFNPGIYVLKDGGLKVAGQATAAGGKVGFFITGNAKAVQFTAKTHISFTAPVDGAMAGLLFFEDRNLAAALKHRITSDDARVLLGTIYLPVGDLVIDAKEPVADQSAYTAIVAQSVDLNMGPNLVLNADYGLTDVPVPAGISGSSQVVLSN